LYFSMIAILPTAITLTNGLIAITINFYIYTFKWTSETSLAKNSCSVIIYAVYVWILVGILSLLIYLLINQIFVVVICVYCYILLAIIMCIILLAKNKIHFF
jgi:hypothetical protein